MAKANLGPKVFRKILNDAMGRKSKSTDVKQLIDENRINEIVSGNNNTA